MSGQPAGQRFVLHLAEATLPSTTEGRPRVISDRASAQDAVLAALGGADLVLLCRASDDVLDDLVEDLSRLGSVELFDEARTPGTELAPEQLELLALLQAGRTLGAAAEELHLSRRTADRRLAAARRALGVRTTPEALVAAARAGLLGGSRPGRP